jgi:RNA polymerase primary sigma factor
MSDHKVKETDYEIEWIVTESTENQADLSTKDNNLVSAFVEDYRQKRVESGDGEDTLSQYMREVGNLPLLTQDEEVQLAKRIERGHEARASLASGTVSDAQRKELQSIVEDGWAAQETLVTRNSRLVISVAKKYLGKGVPFSDLIQDGNVGLIRATKKFDYRKGYKFSTYATWWIRQAITRGIAEHSRTIRLPVHLNDQLNKLRRINHLLTQKLGRLPSSEELAEAVEWPHDKVEYMLEVSQTPLSLESPTNDEEDTTLGDYIADDQADSPIEEVSTNMMNSEIREVLQSLPPREAHILELRFGLADGKSHSLQEVGELVGITRERVRQIESQAMKRLRKPEIRSKLHAYLGS